MTDSPTPLKVLFVASEVAPFAKTGGLGDVIGALPKALRRRGIDVRVVAPLYAGMSWDSLEKLDGPLSVPMWWGTAKAGVRLGHLPGSEVPVYFLEYNRFFDRPYLYGPPGESYPDNLERFSFLSRGALELAKAVNFTPDVIHAHDWQTALVPAYVNTTERGMALSRSATVFTIHNLAHQGVMDGGAMFITGLDRSHYHPGEFEHFGSLNLVKAAVSHSTVISTVSPTYAREILTREYGFGLDGVLAARRSELFGILNGIDGDEWNPSADSAIPAKYSSSRPEGKAACKSALQAEAGLPANPRTPLLAVIGRLSAQKGLDVLARCASSVLSWETQLVLLGSGDPDAANFFAGLSHRRPEKFKAWSRFDNSLAHRIAAGADFVLMPSRFEPCGLVQMYSLCYGALPIVRGTGGLLDTVQNYNERTGDGTGFVFYHLTPSTLSDTIGWAVSTYFDRWHHIQRMRQRAMEQDFSWDKSAAEYERMYLQAYQRRRGVPFPGWALGRDGRQKPTSVPARRRVKKGPSPLPQGEGQGEGKQERVFP